MTTTQQAHHAPTAEELEIAQLRAENARLRANKESTGLGLKVSEKGGVSVYGIGRFPVTLYASQWLKLIGKINEIAQFIETNKHLLKEKEPKIKTA